MDENLRWDLLLLKGTNSQLKNPKLSLCGDLCAPRTPLKLDYEEFHKTKFQNIFSRELPTGTFWWPSSQLSGNWLGEIEKSESQVYQHSDSFYSYFFITNPCQTLELLQYVHMSQSQHKSQIHSSRRYHCSSFPKLPMVSRAPMTKEGKTAVGQLLWWLMLI